MRIFLLFLLLFALAFQPSSQSHAQAEKDNLGQLQKKLEAKKTEKKSIERDKNKTKKSYQKAQKDLVKTSASVQKNQSELHRIETRLENLRLEQKDIKAQIKEERHSMAQTIAALEKIRRTPPQAMIAKPGAPIDTARGALLLQRILPVLYDKAQTLKEKSERYAANETELEKKQKKLVALSKDLSRKEKTLKKLVQERKTKYASLNADLDKRQKQIASVSKKADNLAELVKKLEDERTRNAKRKAAARKKPIKQAALPVIGKTQLPLKGTIRTKYNQTDDFGAKSKGVSIEGRGGALIVSPMGGIIRFAGSFKNYGNMIIIEHQNGYHSLIAGLEKIDTVVDQSVLAGEPLGHLYRSKNDKPPTLYFELRHKGKSINPARKFTELG